MNSVDRIAAALGAIIGFAGAAILHLFTVASPIFVSVFLATGVSALVYGFLGGIQGATFGVGALKLGGTMAALVGTAALFNGMLVKQAMPLRLGPESLVGEWRWADPAVGWEGTLHIFPTEKNRTTFTGNVKQRQGDGSWKDVYYMTDGEAQMRDLTSLHLKCKVKDLFFNRDIVVETAEPLRGGRAFAGQLRAYLPNHADLGLEGYRWGFSIYKIGDK